MIIPENNIPLDDSENSDSEDQQSQQDIHSNGFNEDPEATIADDSASDADRLRQADQAAESAYTLNIDKGIAPRVEKKNDSNIKP
jgi:hypothetical protein